MVALKQSIKSLLPRSVREFLVYNRPSRFHVRFDEYLGLKLLGHGAGFTNALAGQYKIKTASKWHGEASPASMEMKSVGFSNIGQLYDPAVIKKIRKEWDAISGDETKFKWVSDVCQQITHPEVNLPSLDLLVTDELLDHFRGYFGTEVEILSVLCWRIYGVKEEEREKYFFSNWWHFDLKTTSVVKAFIALDDVTEKDGPFHIYPIDTSQEYVKKGYRSRYKYGQASDIDHNKDIYRMTGAKGTTVICNTELCLHKAGVPFEGHYRDMIQFQIGPSKNSNWDKSSWKKNLVSKGVDA